MLFKISPIVKKNNQNCRMFVIPTIKILQEKGS